MANSSTNVRAQLGQNTGKPSYVSNTPEAIMLLNLIGKPDREEVQTHLNQQEYTFLVDMYEKWSQYGRGLVVTGRQLFYLRDVKDKLIDGGII